METVLSSLSKFINYQRERGIAPDLLARWSPNMETQVLVNSAGGRPVEGKPGCFTDGKNTWWNIRVPRNADSEPEFNDYKIDWPYDLYAGAIGCTGWDWQNRVSRWVGFDFDALVGHAKGVGVSDEELEAVKAKAQALPYVEVRRSTGGAGLHLYVHVDVPTANHTVHAALARCVLGMMSAETGFDFSSRIDCCGGNMWIWRDSLEPEHPGLGLLKSATHYLTESDLPSNWRDHITVVKNKKGKLASDASVAALSTAIKEVSLDEEHKKLMEALSESGYETIWVSDYHCLHTKTKALQDIFESQTIPIAGVFRTLSEGNEPSKPNCYMFPLEGGGWRVYRFNNAAEEDTWSQDNAGRTTCLFNRRATLKTAALFYGGVEDAETNEFVFTNPEGAIDTARCLGDSLTLPNEFIGREVRLSKSKDGRLTVKVRKNATETSVNGWVDKRTSYYKVLRTTLDERSESYTEHDEVFRKLISPSGGDAGWVLKNQDRWAVCKKDDIKNRLESIGVSKGDINSLLGNALYKPWKLVNLPFQEEYPGGRQWNLNAAQFVYMPTEEDEQHPTWDMVMTHCGADLDDAISQLEWCKEESIFTGADYLIRWIASAFRCPFEPLPYLFFFGPQDSGKSTFHESIAMLTTKGCVRANRALVEEFNGMLENAVFCVVEEQNVALNAGAYNKIKDLVTAREISIRKMRTDSYMMPNATKWMQCANKRSFCPIFKGDSRITAMYVRVPEHDIPKEELLQKLRDEAPAFMRTLMSIELPKPRGRLRLPIIETANKQRAAQANSNAFEDFVEESLVAESGSHILLKDFNERFKAALSEEDANEWGRGVNTKDFDSLPTPISSQHTKKGKKLIDVRWSDSYATSA